MSNTNTIRLVPEMLALPTGSLIASLAYIVYVYAEDKKVEVPVADLREFLAEGFELVNDAEGTVVTFGVRPRAPSPPGLLEIDETGRVSGGT